MKRLRNIVVISEEQFGFMKGKSTTDAIFVLRELQERYREVHLIGEEHVLSVRNCSELSCKNRLTLCSGSPSPPRICFQPYPVCHHNRFTDERKHLGI